MARIRIESATHEFYRTLARDDGDTATKKTFETMKEVFMIAFGFGVANSQRGALGPSREVFDDSLFRSEDWDLIKAAALADDATALQSLEETDQLLKVAQEYANAGIRLMQSQYLAAKPEESLAALLLDALATEVDTLS